MPEVGAVQIGGGILGERRGSVLFAAEPKLRADSIASMRIPPLRTSVPDGLQAQAALAPPPGYTADSSGPVQAAAPPTPLVAPAYSIRHHVALVFPKPLPVAPPSTGNFDLVGERGAPNSGIGATEEPEISDGLARAGVWREAAQPILAPPILDSHSAVDLTESREDLGVLAPAGAYLVQAGIGVLEEDAVDDFSVSPPEQAVRSALEAEGADRAGSSPVPGSTVSTATKMSPTFPLPSQERSTMSEVGTAGPVTGLGSRGGGMHIAPSIRPSIRPSVLQKPGSGRGGGISAVRNLIQSANQLRELRKDIDGHHSVDLADKKASTYAAEKEDRLRAEVLRQYESAKANFSNIDQFNARWQEAKERQENAEQREIARYVAHYGDMRGSGILAANHNLQRARAARDSATSVKAATAGHKGFADPAKAKEARSKSKEALKKAKEAKKAAQAAKNAQKYGTAEQAAAAKEKSDALAEEAAKLALLAEQLLEDANRPYATKPEDCGDPKEFCKCEPECPPGFECECTWTIEKPEPGAGGGTKGKGVKGSEKAPVAPDGTPKSDGASKDTSKPKSPIGELITDVEESGLAKGNSSQARFVRMMLRAFKAFGRMDADISRKMEVLQGKVDRLREKGMNSGPLSGSDKYQLSEALKSLLKGQVASHDLGGKVSTLTRYLQEGLSGSERTRAVLTELTDRLQAKRDGVQEAARKTVKRIMDDLRQEGVRSTDQVLRAFDVPERVITGRDRFIPAFRMTASEREFALNSQREAEKEFIRTHQVPELGPRPDEDVGLEMVREAERALEIADSTRELANADAEAMATFDSLAKQTVDGMLDAMKEVPVRFMDVPSATGTSERPLSPIALEFLRAAIRPRHPSADTKAVINGQLWMVAGEREEWTDPSVPKPMVSIDWSRAELTNNMGRSEYVLPVGDGKVLAIPAEWVEVQILKDGRAVPRGLTFDPSKEELVAMARRPRDDDPASYRALEAARRMSDSSFLQGAPVGWLFSHSPPGGRDDGSAVTVFDEYFVKMMRGEPEGDRHVGLYAPLSTDEARKARFKSDAFNDEFERLFPESVATQRAYIERQEAERLAMAEIRRNPDLAPSLRRAESEGRSIDPVAWVESYKWRRSMESEVIWQAVAAVGTMGLGEAVALGRLGGRVLHTAKVARYLEQGYSQRAAEELASLYTRQGHHFVHNKYIRKVLIPRYGKDSLRGRFLEWFVDSSWNLKKLPGSTKGEFYEFHARLHGAGGKAPFGRKFFQGTSIFKGGESWRAAQVVEGLEPFSKLEYLWYGSPTRLKVAAGAAGEGLARTGYAAWEVLSPDDSEQGE